MNMVLRDLQKPLFSAVAFFFSLCALSVWYAAYGALSNVNSGEPLTKNLWNVMVGDLADHETRINALNAASPGFAKAWVNFDGTAAACPSGNCTIRSAYNVSSVTRITNGAYVVNFAAPMNNANYLVTGATKADPAQGYAISEIRLHSYSPTGTSSYTNVAPTASSFTFSTMVEGYTNGTDVQYANLVVYGN